MPKAVKLNKPIDVLRDEVSISNLLHAEHLSQVLLYELLSLTKVPCSAIYVDSGTLVGYQGGRFRSPKLYSSDWGHMLVLVALH